MFIILKIKTPPPIGWRDLKPPPAGGEIVRLTLNMYIIK